MNGFVVNSELKSAFLVNRSQIEGRLDPSAYHLERLAAVAKIKNSDGKVIPLKYAVSFKKEIVSEAENFIIYLGLENIVSETGEYVPTENKEEFSSAVVFRKGDVLFPKLRPALNKVYYAEFNGVCSTEFHILRSHLVDNRYLAHFLRSNLVVSQTRRLTSGNTLPRLQTEDIQNLLLPIKSSEVQNRIIELMEEKCTAKQIKEAQAAEKIAQIDDYLLAELGINVPESDDALESRMFTVNFSESSGKRFDPLFFYKNFLDQLPTGRYPVEPLGRHVAYLQTGFAAGKGDQSTNDADVIQLRPTNLNDDRELVFDRNVYIHRDALTKRPGDVLQPGEVLFNNTNSQELVGKSVLFDLDGDYFCSNHMTRISTADTLHPDYLAHLLNLYQRQNVFFRVCTNWNNQSGVNNGVLAGVPILVPSLERQREIARTITDLRSSARKLRQEAKDELERARQQVERMIVEE